MASRGVFQLRSELQSLAVAFQKACVDAELDVLIYCTFRSIPEQARLWRIGRSLAVIQRKVFALRQSGRAPIADIIAFVGPQAGSRIVTNALPGESAHNFRLAFDAVPLVHGKAMWNDAALLSQMGELGEGVGLEWAGRWTRFRESVHFQYPNWRNLVQ